MKSNSVRLVCRWYDKPGVDCEEPATHQCRKHGSRFSMPLCQRHAARYEMDEDFIVERIGNTKLSGGGDKH